MQSFTTQFTPEQQQWMFLSLNSQNNMNNFPPTFLSSFSKKIVDANASAASKVKAFGLTCEEIEREQMAFYSPFGAAQRTPALPIPMPLEQSDLSSLSPSTSLFSGSWISSSLEELSNEAMSLSSYSTVNEIDGVSQYFLIPFEKSGASDPLRDTGNSKYRPFDCVFYNIERYFFLFT
uniref:Transcription factor bHLH63 n=1 Tax=Angiostrongylus cantonensis TaxID=6313 RepID=A0A0K0DMB5_ANGCA